MNSGKNDQHVLLIEIYSYILYIVFNLHCWLINCTSHFVQNENNRYEKHSCSEFTVKMLSQTTVLDAI